MSNARIHIAGSELKTTQVPNSQATKKNSIKVTIWGELADLIFLWASRLLHIFLPNSTFWPWKCIYMFCYMRLLLTINACWLNYAKTINTTKDITHCILFNLSLLIFFKGCVSVGDAFSGCQLFYKFLHFPWYTCKCWQESNTSWRMAVQKAPR